MSDEIFQRLKEGISHRIACIERPYINGFAGTGVSRKRTTQDVHAIARKIMDRTFDPYGFHWDLGNKEHAEFNDIYLVVFTCLFDIEDEDARRWTSKTEWDIAKNEAAREIARALMRKFEVSRRRLIHIPAKIDHPGGHNGQDAYWEGDRGW